MMGMMISNMLLVQRISASEVKLHVRQWNQWGGETQANYNFNQQSNITRQRGNNKA